MPWVNYIKGNLGVTTTALGLLLGTRVTSEELHIDIQTAQVFQSKLGEAALGTDTVVGNTFQEPSVTWKFNILEVKDDEIEFYRPQNAYGKFLKHFEEKFIPLEIDIIFEFAEIQTLNYETEPVMGYSFVL
jgi:hypothetical protein